MPDRRFQRTLESLPPIKVPRGEREIAKKRKDYRNYKIQGGAERCPHPIKKKKKSPSSFCARERRRASAGSRIQGLVGIPNGGLRVLLKRTITFHRRVAKLWEGGGCEGIRYLRNRTVVRRSFFFFNKLNNVSPLNYEVYSWTFRIDVGLNEFRHLHRHT